MRVEINESDRQMTVLALAELALSRPGWTHALGLIADAHQARDMFERFKELNADRVGPSHFAAPGAERVPPIDAASVPPVDPNPQRFGVARPRALSNCCDTQRHNECDPVRSECACTCHLTARCAPQRISPAGRIYISMGEHTPPVAAASGPCVVIQFLDPEWYAELTSVEADQLALFLVGKAKEVRECVQRKRYEDGTDRF